MNEDLKNILSRVDHTLLSQTATWAEIKTICDDGIKYGCASVCIPQTYVNHAAHYVAEQQHYGFGQLPICTVIGFPLGYETTAAKTAAASQAVKDGRHGGLGQIEAGFDLGHDDAAVTQTGQVVRHVRPGQLQALREFGGI